MTSSLELNLCVHLKVEKSNLLVLTLQSYRISFMKTRCYIVDIGVSSLLSG